MNYPMTGTELDEIEETISSFICNSRMTDKQQEALKSWIRLTEWLHSPQVGLSGLISSANKEEHDQTTYHHAPSPDQPATAAS